MKPVSKTTDKVVDLAKHTARSAKDLAVGAWGTDEVMWETEVSANIFVGKIFWLMIVFSLLSFILERVGIFDYTHTIWILTVVDLVILLPAALVCRITHGRKKFLKIYMMIATILCVAAVDAMLTYSVVLVIVIPVILSSRYYNKKLTWFTAGLTLLAFIGSAYIGVHNGELDLNYIQLASSISVPAGSGILDAVKGADIDQTVYYSNCLIQGFLPKCLLYIIVSVIATNIADRGRKMVEYQAKMTLDHTRIDSELNIARSIQRRALPLVHELENHPSFELRAIMEPAKEVGGDFYDFLMIDDTHLAMIIADVSGKGVPAAMFMMVSKLMLDATMTVGKGPGAVLTEVNHQLCEKNLEDMFVTVWLGIIDLETGRLTATNAGHEYPLLCRKGGKFKVFKDRHGFVLGGMDGVRYKEYELMLKPGDTLFLYTDGVAEANDSEGNFYGIERACQALDRIGTEDMLETLKLMKADIDQFAGDAPQFDDITMMGFRMNNYMDKKGITVVPDRQSIEKVQSYLEEEMEKAEVSMKQIFRINAAVDDMYSNIVNYSHAEWAKVEITISDARIEIVFTDNGIPFDPLAKEDPNIDLSAEERNIGGLGIFLAKKLTDDISYKYVDKCNVTTMIINQMNA